MQALDIPTITLNSGHAIPQLGFGTWQVPPERTAEVAGWALEAGLRHIDTAQMYRNEAGVGEAIRSAGLERDEVFITSKLNNAFHKPDDARRAFEGTLAALGTDHVDLFLIHWPLPMYEELDYVATWNTLIEFAADHRARSIGVSNFQVPHLQRLLDETDVVPAVNQIEHHPYLANEAVRKFGEDHGIVTEAWSPIAQGRILGDPVVGEIAQRLGKTPAQVVLRWHLQHGHVIFPKSMHAERIRENTQLFDFELTEHDMHTLRDLDQGEAGRVGPNPDTMSWLGN